MRKFRSEKLVILRLLVQCLHYTSSKLALRSGSKLFVYIWKHIFVLLQFGANMKRASIWVIHFLYYCYVVFAIVKEESANDKVKMQGRRRV